MKNNPFLADAILASKAFPETGHLSPREKLAVDVILANEVRELNRPDTDRPYFVDLLRMQMLRRGGVLAELKVKNESAYFTVYPAGVGQISIRTLAPQDLSDDDGITIGPADWDLGPGPIAGGVQRIIDTGTQREQYIIAYGWHLLENLLGDFRVVQPNITTEVAAERLDCLEWDPEHMKLSPGIYYTGDTDNFAVSADFFANDVPAPTALRLLGFLGGDGNDLKITR